MSNQPTKAQELRQSVMDDYDTWLKKEYPEGEGVMEVALNHYLWMKDSYGAGDERGAERMKAAVLDLLKNQRIYQSLYKQIEALE